MTKLYRYTAPNVFGPAAPLSGRATEHLSEAIMQALTYGTWAAWFKGSDDERYQPTVEECDGDGPTVGDWGWQPIPTDDPRVLAFFDCPDVDELERQIVESLAVAGGGYGIGPESAEEALTQVEQYDGYRVQSIVHVATDEERSNGTQGGDRLMK